MTSDQLCGCGAKLVPGDEEMGVPDLCPNCDAYKPPASVAEKAEDRSARTNLRGLPGGDSQ